MAVDAFQGALTAWPEPATPELPPNPSVNMRSPGKTILIRGKRKGPLSDAEYKAIAVLRKAWPARLTLKQMDQAYGSTGWRKTLIRLREKDADFATAIGFPGKKTSIYDGVGFGILPW